MRAFVCVGSVTNFVEVSSDGHLLVELRRLSQVSAALEVRNSEEVGAALRRCRDDLRRVNLDESLLCEMLAKQTTDARFDAVDRLIGRCAEIQDSIVQSHVLIDCR